MLTGPHDPYFGSRFLRTVTLAATASPREHAACRTVARAWYRHARVRPRVFRAHVVEVLDRWCRTWRPFFGDIRVPPCASRLVRARATLAAYAGRLAGDATKWQETMGRRRGGVRRALACRTGWRDRARIIGLVALELRRSCPWYHYSHQWPTVKSAVE